ncbi:MAG: hypothetical protein ABI599_06240 [Flavobacteriales bacterium]
MDLLLRVASWIWPVRIARYHGLFGPLDVCYQYGRKVLNTANANQSFGSLHAVWQRTFAAIGLKKNLPSDILLLGLGGGSAVRIIRRDLGCKAPITAIEADPAMKRIAKDHFGLGGVKDIDVRVEDAFVALSDLKGPFGLVLVDVFKDHLVPEQLAEPVHLARLLELTRPSGNLLINTMAVDEASTRISDAIQFGLLRSGAEVHVLNPMPENRMMWVRKAPH